MRGSSYSSTEHGAYSFEACVVVWKGREDDRAREASVSVDLFDFESEFSPPPLIPLSLQNLNFNQSAPPELDC